MLWVTRRTRPISRIFLSGGLLQRLWVFSSRFRGVDVVIALRRLRNADLLCFPCLSRRLHECFPLSVWLLSSHCRARLNLCLGAVALDCEPTGRLWRCCTEQNKKLHTEESCFGACDHK